MDSRKLLVPLALGAAALALPVVAHAQDQSAVDRARALGEEGAHAYERGEWEAARSLFHRARDLYPAPTLGVREARALVKLGRLLEAERVYDRVASSPLDLSDRSANVATFRAAQADARAELTALRTRIPHLTLRVDGKFDRVSLGVDGQAVPPTLIGIDHEIDPGLHTIVATFDDKAQSPTTVTLALGDRRTLVFHASGAQPSAAVVTPPPANAAPPPAIESGAAHGVGMRVAGFVGVGLGAVGVGLGIVFGVIATSKHSDLDAVCSGSVCPPSAAGTLDDFHAFRTVSTVAYVAGGVLAAGGLGLVLLAPSSKHGSHAAYVQAYVGPLGAGLRGAF